MENTDNIERVDLERVDWRSSREFFESLGEALDKLDDKDESYNFTWVGKRKSIIEAGAPINKTLRPDIDASKDFDNTKNMLIVGDNLDALKLLQESYLGQIKMIYIDPPYNTGHDFVYHDNFTIKKDDYEDNSVDEDGNKVISEDPLRENSKSNGRFHSDWLSMMYPRLKLARNLLTDDGVIFISIDDNEQSNLKKLCDEVFGEDNFISNIIWYKNNSKGNVKTISCVTEYVLCYAKNAYELPEFKRDKKNAAEMCTVAKQLFEKNNHNIEATNSEFRSWMKEHDISAGEKKYNKVDENGRLYTDKPLTAPGSKLFYDILHPITKKPCKTASRGWAYKKESLEELLKSGHILFGKDETTCPYLKYFLDENLSEVPTSHIQITANNSVDLQNLGFKKEEFDYPKPLLLIDELLSMFENRDSIILDFFAGSGTTAHAVMQKNASDNGNRKHILVQLPEKNNNTTLEELTAERLRRAGDKIIKEHPDLEGKLDTGFRVFRIDSENENTDIRKPLKDVSQTDLFNSIDNIKKDRTSLDLLFGVVYASALPFDLKLETKKIGDNTIYLYGYLDEDSGLVACFDDNISEDTIKEIAKLKPLTAAFKDSSFQDSAAKINLSEQFRVIAPDTKVKVI